MSLLQIFGFTHTAKAVTAESEAAQYVTKTPNPAAEICNSKVEEAPTSFACLDDIFGEMIEDEHPLALSKW